MWIKYDDDANGYLDKNESRPFIEHVAKIIDTPKAKNYQSTKFDELFEMFDEDQNGFLSKAEMATLIKKTFKPNQQSQMQGEALKDQSQTNGNLKNSDEKVAEPQIE